MKLKAFEHLPVVNLTEDTTDTKECNTILFIGGLGDDILFPHYVHRRVVPAIYGDEELLGWWVAGLRRWGLARVRVGGWGVLSGGLAYRRGEGYITGERWGADGG